MKIIAKYRFLIPIFLMLMMLIIWLFVIDTPMNTNTENWITTEATIIKLEDANQLKDEAKGREFFNNLVATVQYVNLKGESAQAYIFEYDRHFDRIFYPEGAQIAITYNKDTGAAARLWYTIVFKYLLITLLIAILFFLLKFMITRIRKTAY